ncbi:BTB-domain-containing protein [Rhizophagus irregularis]|uniref:BTB-domain-containing protein n=1 Tax=Rhizophagus irregularis TaxID=588596 RepID=A0A2N1NL20_9GLOM|nr:BTB-domain-containing protein [Rhizophagus irregularis]
MLNNSDDYNVIIQVGENHNMKEFRIHSNILRARSPYFKNALSTLSGRSSKRKTDNSKRNDIIEFKKPNINPNSFELILKYIYTGEVDLSKQPGEDILGVLVASDELQLGKLFDHVQDHLIEKQSVWVKQNYVLVLHTIFKLSNCKKLQDHCIKSICADPKPFITSENFPSLDKDIVYELLKRDDLQIEEAVAWDHLIKWGIEQTPGLGSKNNDRAKWSDSNYKALKRTLSHFIPLIRFVEISPADFYDKVRPYKAVIPEYIYEDITEFYYKNTLPEATILPPRNAKVRIESKLIKLNLAGIIAGWIERRNDKELSHKYNFDLLYRSSQDGVNTNTFRTKCDNQGPCLVLVKHQQSTKIYGGYNPIGFINSGSQWRNTTESFVFSFENGRDIQNMKISRVNVNNGYNAYAIYEDYNQGFSFGNTFYMNSDHKIYFSNQGYYDNFGNVSSPYLNNNFVPEEIEVFKITTS